ncbi:hypothetical protein V8C34DRAFT_297913 [Trichoderma compactum]
MAVKLWDVTTGHCLATLQDDDKILLIAFAPNSQQLASLPEGVYTETSRGNATKLWDIRTGRCTAVLRCKDEFMWSIVFLLSG